MIFNKNLVLKLKNKFSWGMLVVMLLGSCSKKDDLGANKLEFEQTSYSIPQSGEVIMKIVTLAPVTTNTTVPFTLSGSAVKDVDYKLSAEAFVIPAGGTIGEVKVTVNSSFTLDKSFKVDLGTIPSNVQSGNLLFTEVSIGPKDILLYSFEAQKSTMTETAEIPLILTAAEGYFNSKEELRIPVEVAAGTTAVEGVHFSFDGPKEFVFAPGKLRTTLKLKFLKQEAGKTLIVLKAKPANNHYVAGNYNSTKITIAGSNFSRLKGTWKFKDFSNLEWVMMNSMDGDDASTLPKHTANDLIVINDAGLNVEMTGGLKNYLRTATLTDKGEVTERLIEEGFPFPAVKMQLVQLSAMNVFFSPVKQKIRSGEIGLRVFIKDGKDILEVTIRDYEPTDFLSGTYEMYSTFGDVPAMKTMPLRFHFERVN